MKIILSRKGFDGESGGYPSPILPNGRLFSLPIPSRECDNRYAELCDNVGLPAKLVEQLTRGRFKASWRAHLDPDLRKKSLRRRKDGWRGLYGAGEAPGSGAPTLKKHRVGPGDLFLFYGWFRRTTLKEGKIRYDRAAPHIHALFGWLQVDKVLDAKETKRSLPRHLRWAEYFGHFGWESGMVFVARKHLLLPGLSRRLPGGGVFDVFRQELQLTAPERYQEGKWKKSTWMLPRWFWPGKRKPPLGRHRNMRRWELKSKCVILESVPRGQEFVLDTRYYPEAKKWARELIEGNYSAVGRKLWPSCKQGA